jgi:predicted  nucleic acid-binding Zn-ribbon protein
MWDKERENNQLKQELTELRQSYTELYDKQTDLKYEYDKLNHTYNDYISNMGSVCHVQTQQFEELKQQLNEVEKLNVLLHFDLDRKNVELCQAYHTIQQWREHSGLKKL